MRFITLAITFSLFFSIIFISFSKANDLETFLKSKASKVDQEELVSFINYFLDPRYRKKNIFWFTGTLYSEKGEQFENIKLKFNTVSNSLYAKHNSQIYRITTSAIKGFLLNDGGKDRLFQKGYSGVYLHTIVVTLEAEVLEGLTYITGYEGSKDLRIFYVNAAEISPGVRELTIRFSSQGITPVNNFQKHLMLQEGSINAQLVSEKPEFNESNFLELMAKGKSGNFLKLNYKDMSQGQNMTLIKQTDTNTYNDNVFFISNLHNELVEVQFNKRSIKSALVFAGAEVPRNLPSFRNENQLASWLKKVL